MSNYYGVLEAIAVLASALLGVIVTFWPPVNPNVKLATVFTFAVLGLTAIWFKQQKETADQTKAQAVAADLVSWQRGDPLHPPIVQLLFSRKPNDYQVILGIENVSDFPAYDVSLRLWDLDNVPKVPNLQKLNEWSLIQNLS